HTRTNLLAVQQHRASATLRQAAPEARTMQVELVVQDVQERCIAARGRAVHETVDLDLQLARHTTLHFLGRKARRGAGTTTDTSPTAARRRYERRWSVCNSRSPTIEEFRTVDAGSRIVRERAIVSKDVCVLGSSWGCSSCWSSASRRRARRATRTAI